ncbi:unnamed protein product, partial [Mesorhabditis belari]|uniref:Uncharacterized protein n=1 Tax=Mesorhabditis belari TaxID=2138241 RepID=A0AAF3EPK4_9BILA
MIVKERRLIDHDKFIPHKDISTDQKSKSFCPPIINFCVAVISFQFNHSDILFRFDVFARMAPEQSKCSKYLQTLDYTVAMCGDGANDCAALKAADIRCVPGDPREVEPLSSLLLVSSNTWPTIYSIAQFSTVMLVYFHLNAVPDLKFLFIDLFLYATFIAMFLKHWPRILHPQNSSHCPQWSALSGKCSFLDSHSPPKLIVDLLEFDPIPYFSVRLYIMFTALACCAVAYLFNTFVVEYLIIVNWRNGGNFKIGNPKSTIPKWERIMLRIATNTSWISEEAKIENRSLDQKQNPGERRATFEVIDEAEKN